MARQFSIKGPARDGAMVFDEGGNRPGGLTRAVVDRLGAKSGADGNKHAGEIWGARRDLWRILEACAPRVVAKHLRRRAAKLQDYSNRGAVGDLRHLVADWLDPPEPTCPGCRRPASQRHAHRRKRPPAPLPAPGRAVVGVTRRVAWTEAVHAWEAERARQVAQHLGLRRDWVRRIRERTPGRWSALDLFGELVAASGRGRARFVGHGAATIDGAPVTPFPGERRPPALPPTRRYDVEVDRDGEVLRQSVREVLGDDLFEACAEGRRDVRALVVAATAGAWVDRDADDPRGPGKYWQPRTQAADNSPVARAIANSPLVSRAWWRFCRVLERAFEENGRLYLKAQGKYAPAGTVARADLVQESAAGAIRGLYDYNPKHGKHGCKVSTYLVGWCRQSMSHAFARRDEVHTPAWLRDLRANLERGGVDLRAARIAVEACAALRSVVSPKGDAAATPAERAAWAAARAAEADAFARAVVGAVSGRTPPAAWDPAADLVLVDDAGGAAGRLALAAWRRGDATIADAWAARAEALRISLTGVLLATNGEVERQESASRTLALAAGLVVKVSTRAKGAGAAKAGSKGPKGRKAKAGVKKPTKTKGAPVGVTGAGVLQALRFEEFRRHSLVFGDGDGDGASKADGGEAYDPRSREPADEADPERIMLEAEAEDRDAEGLSSLAAALETLRLEDPRACEVVRRREGLGEQGDGETLAQIAEGLDGDTPRRVLSRDEVRRLYNGGVKRLRALVGDALGSALGEDAGDDEGDWAAPAPSATRRVWKPLRPAAVRTVVAESAPARVAPPAETAAWFAERDAVDAIAW